MTNAHTTTVHTGAESNPLIPIPAVAEGHAYQHIVVEQYAGACGAIISGIDLAQPLPDVAVAEIRRAILDHLVVFFRDQSLSPEQQVEFSHRFGPYNHVPFIEPVAGHPEVIAVAREPQETQGFAFGSLWHSDFSFLPEPPMGSILHAIEVPPYGADTLWSNQYLAFSTLSPGLQQTLRTLRGIHSATNAYSKKMQGIHDSFAGMRVQTSDTANEVIEHPLVRIHAETGRPALYADQQYTIGIAGWANHEAKQLLDYLYQHSVQPAFTCRWQWKVGDVAFWDNRCLQHMAMADVSGHRRLLHRTTVAGERPLGS